MVSISGLGQDGPYAHYKAPDIVCMAMSGYMNLMGDPDRAPVRIGIPQSYLHASNDAVAAAMIALWHREVTGAGQWVDVSARECLAWLGFSNYIIWDFQGYSRRRSGPAFEFAEGRAAPWIYPCKDGYVLFTPISPPVTGRTRAMVEWMEEEEKTNDLLREVDWEALTPISEMSEREWEQTLAAARSFGPFLLSKTKGELFEQAVSRGFLLAPLNSMKDLIEDAHLQSRQFWQSSHPKWKQRPSCCSTRRLSLRRER